MKTWNQFLEAKQNEMGMPPGTGLYPGQPSARRSATLSLSPAQKAQGLQAHQAAQQPPPQAGPVSDKETGAQYRVGLRPQYAKSKAGPVSDEETGAQYAKSMQIQQAMAKAKMGQGQRQV